MDLYLLKYIHERQQGKVEGVKYIIPQNLEDKILKYWKKEAWERLRSWWIDFIDVPYIQ